MDHILDLLCRSGVVPSTDLAVLRTELRARPDESTADLAARTIEYLSTNYRLSASHVAQALVRAQLEEGNGLRVLTPILRVLLVEDNPADVELTRRALIRQRRFELVGIAKDGEEALAFLRREPPFENAKSPDLILLDLDLPGRDGFEVLRELKSSPDLGSTPVLVLSGSTRRDAPELAFRQHAVSFIAKPTSLADYRRVASQIEVYWSQITALP